MLLRILVIMLFAASACCSQAVCTAGPPAWQPYRITAGQLASEESQFELSNAASNEPAHYVEPAQYVMSEPAQGLPIEALTDVELEHLTTNCGDPVCVTATEIDPVLSSHWATQHNTRNSASGAIELLPSDVIWHSYWAGAKEARTSGTVFEEFSDDVSQLDVTLGGRTSILRNATRNDVGLWYGWELQIEGAAMLRLNLDENWDFDAADFRFGVPFILARNQLHWKFAYYHLSSHVGDEFLVRNPGFTRINFSRDVLVFGASYFPRPAWRWYAETGFAFYEDEGSEQWEFQFGVDYAQPGPTGGAGTPFVALNAHLREEVDFGGNLVAQAGWLWRGHTGRVLRTGLHYYNGKSPQFEFFDRFEQHVGIGLWQEY